MNELSALHFRPLKDLWSMLFAAAGHAAAQAGPGPDVMESVLCPIQTADGCSINPAELLNPLLSTRVSPSNIMHGRIVCFVVPQALDACWVTCILRK